MISNARPAGQPPPYSLFGLDLSVAWQYLREGWQEVFRHPALARWLPSEPLRLVRPDRTEVFMVAGRTASNVRKRPRFTGVELPDDIVLRKTLRLPNMPQAGIAAAARLEALACSPFPTPDLVWGFRGEPKGQGVTVDVVLASRAAVEAYIQSLGLASTADAPEVFATGGVSVPGFGEQRRVARERRVRRILGGSLAVLALLGAALAVTPTLQLRARALEAQQQFLDLRARTGPQAEQRARVLAAAEQLAELEGRIVGPEQALRALDALTDALPDDTVLNVLELSRERVRLAGLTANAAGLMQKLGDDPRFRDVRAPAASTRAGSGQESFTIELSLPPSVAQPSGPGA